jgi:hypothetical protein
MTPTLEEQLEFATENSRLVADMGKIIDTGPSAESIAALNANLAAQRTLWENYNKKYTKEVIE